MTDAVNSPTAEEESITIKFSQPITYAGQTFTEATLREPIVNDLRIMQDKEAARDPVGATNRLFSALTEGQVPPQVFNAMKLRDQNKLNAWFKPFFQGESDDK